MRFFVQGNVVVLDNASNNKHGKSIASLEDITQGNYIFNAPYQHYYAPIERGFSNVMCEVRLREDQAMISPRIIIEEAFMKYSVIGSHGHVGKQKYLFNSIFVLLYKVTFLSWLSYTSKRPFFCACSEPQELVEQDRSGRG